MNRRSGNQIDFKQLKSAITEISDIASSVPEQFRDKCFETLLNALLAGEKAPTKEHEESKESHKDAESHKKPPAGSVSLNAQLRVFLRKTKVTDEELNKVVLVEGEEVHFVQVPSSKNNTRGQLDWSLLLGLKNAILKNSFEVDPEEVRSKCIDVGFYDKANFAANFKKEKFTKLFKGTLTSQGKAVALSPEGQDALGELVKALAGEAK